MDMDALVRRVTNLALEAILTEERNSQDDPRQLQSRVDSIRRKKEAVMDSYFSGEITQAEMATMKEKYTWQITDLQTRIALARQQKQENRDPEARKTALISAIWDFLTGEAESVVFCKTMVDRLTVYPDRHMELKLNHLDLIFPYTG